MGANGLRLAVAALGIAFVATFGTAARAAPDLAGLTQAKADAAMRAYVLGKTPHAVPPSVELPLCPISEIDDGESNPPPGQLEVLCIAEHHVGNIWGSVAGELMVRHGAIRFRMYADRTWTRRWVTCSKLHGWAAPLVFMQSNNDCGEHSYGGNDWYLAGGLYVPVSFLSNNPRYRFDPAGPAGWDWTNSAGYSVGLYNRTARHGQVYTYTNDVGDSFRIRP